MPSLKVLLYTTFTVLTLPARLLGICLYYLPRFTRPNAAWSYKATVNLKLITLWFRYATAVKWRTAKSLEPGPDGDRFIVMNPPTRLANDQNDPQDAYQGILRSDPAICPVPIGAVWYPAAPAQDQPPRRLILHFHPGAYVLFGPRPSETGWGPENFSKQSGWPVLSVQYRLSLEEHTSFPAAVQDGITAYIYALKTLGIPASEIVLSGESAGANLVCAILRYLTTEKQPLPLPRAALLWHPWVDLREKAIAGIERHRNFASDYLFYDLIEWGADRYTPSGWSRDHPYISPLGNELHLAVPLFIQTGTAEVLYDDHVQFAKNLKEKGNEVEFHEVPNAAHAAFGTGEVFDTVDASLEGHKLAADFIARAGK